MMTAKYQSMDSCNKCGLLENNSTITHSEEGCIYEARTECASCGHKDYWQEGFFESGREIISKAQQYYFEDGKIQYS